MRESPQQSPEALPELTIVGRGRVGSAVARAGREAGLETSFVHRERLGADTAGAELVLICVPDGEVFSVAEALAGSERPPLAAGHVSGATGLDALEPLAAGGTVRFAMHPLQTITEADSDLEGAPCAIGGCEGGRDIAGRLARALGMEPFALADDQRAAYHAAASIAANFLVALEESAAELMSRATGSDGHALLGPLVERTCRNWRRDGAAALTGPIARGDEQTVALHLRALEREAPELLDLYEAMAGRTRALATGTVAS